MRLGQLARKLSVTPAEIIEFLFANQAPAEEGVNTKLEKEQVSLLMQRFAPSVPLESMLADATVQEEITIVSEPVEETIAENEPTTAEEKEAIAPVASEAIGQPAEEKPEVIKATKVELAGLKVLGKIELPTKKKAEPPQDTTATATDASPAPESANAGARPERRSKPVGRKNNHPGADRRDQRPRKNPVAQQREREAQEAENKRKAEAELKKEKQTQYYLKKVKTSGPTKAAKLYKEDAIEMSGDLTPSPKTWLGKLLRWFKS